MLRIQELLAILVKAGALKNEKFTIDRVAYNPKVLKLLSLAFLYYIRGIEVDIESVDGSTPGAENIEKVYIKAVGGSKPGAEDIAKAVVHQSNFDSQPLITGFTISEECIEGELEENIPVVIVNTTCVTGTSLLEMITNIEDRGHKVMLVIVLVDFCKGGREKLIKANYDFVSLFEVTPEGLVVSTESKAR